MFLHKLPCKIQKLAQLSVLAASVSLFAIAAYAGSNSHKAGKGVIETANEIACNGVIRGADEVILPN